MAQAITRADPHFRILTYEAAQECIRDAEHIIDILVYCLHRANAASFSDIVSLRRSLEKTPLVLISDTTAISAAVVRNLLLEGVSGFLHSTVTSVDVVVGTLTLIRSGGSSLPKEFVFLDERPERRTWPSGSSDQCVLTSRELAVLHQVREGQPNKVIASELGVRPNTVKVHMRNIMRKMGTTNRTQAAILANNAQSRQSLHLE